MRRFMTVAAVSALMLVLSAVPALALPPADGYICDGGTPTTPEEIPAGTYSSLTVTGNCFFGTGNLTVNGNVTVQDGAVLNDHGSFQPGTRVINGNVKVGEGAVLGLGSYVPGLQDTTVNGNITANKPLTLYLSFMTVHGNVVSNGGGSADEFRNFPIKDITVDGNLILQGWHGGWLGVIRDHVGGNVNVSKNVSVVIETGPEGCPETEPCTGQEPGIDADSTEVQTNVIGGNLICHGNTPAAQANIYDGGMPNEVGGNAVGECADLTGHLVVDGASTGPYNGDTLSVALTVYEKPDGSYTGLGFYDYGSTSVPVLVTDACIDEATNTTTIWGPSITDFWALSLHNVSGTDMEARAGTATTMPGLQSFIDTQCGSSPVFPASGTGYLTFS